MICGALLLSTLLGSVLPPGARVIGPKPETVVLNTDETAAPQRALLIKAPTQIVLPAGKHRLVARVWFPTKLTAPPAGPLGYKLLVGKVLSHKAQVETSTEATAAMLGKRAIQTLPLEEPALNLERKRKLLIVPTAPTRRYGVLVWFEAGATKSRAARTPTGRRAPRGSG